jgi:hypothetical protein
MRVATPAIGGRFLRSGTGSAFSSDLTLLEGARMTTEKDLGTVPAVPAGDEETVKHPANDAAPAETDVSLGQSETRDREARLSQGAGDAADEAHTKARSDVKENGRQGGNH